MGRNTNDTWSSDNEADWNRFDGTSISNPNKPAVGLASEAMKIQGLSGTHAAALPDTNSDVLVPLAAHVKQVMDENTALIEGLLTPDIIAAIKYLKEVFGQEEFSQNLFAKNKTVDAFLVKLKQTARTNPALFLKDVNEFQGVVQVLDESQNPKVQNALAVIEKFTDTAASVASISATRLQLVDNPPPGYSQLGYSAKEEAKERLAEAKVTLAALTSEEYPGGRPSLGFSGPKVG